jgi:glycosyltransferase involved in cell wall biosynthesis
MEEKKTTISVIVLTRNEEPVITDCLESVRWADEIVVIDHGSTDKTLEIVKKFGVKEIINAPENSNFSDRRNLGVKEASGEWLLYVDADERVTPELKREILSIVHSSSFKSQMSAYAIPRKNIRLSKVLYHGGWWPDYVLRLIKKEKLKSWKGELHEQPRVEGEVGKLKEAFVHFSHRGSFEHKLQNTINWSKIEAQKMYDANHPTMTVFRFLSAMWREFFRRMIKYQAWRDGLEGVIEAIYQVFSVFISYARLWEMQNQNQKSKCKN